MIIFSSPKVLYFITHVTSTTYNSQELNIKNSFVAYHFIFSNIFSFFFKIRVSIMELLLKNENIIIFDKKMIYFFIVSIDNVFLYGIKILDVPYHIIWLQSTWYIISVVLQSIDGFSNYYAAGNPYYPGYQLANTTAAGSSSATSNSQVYTLMESPTATGEFILFYNYIPPVVLLTYTSFIWLTRPWEVRDTSFLWLTLGGKRHLIHMANTGR